MASLGYEPIRNEEGNIPYGKADKLEEYCYKEIQNVDILISIIGGRFGMESQCSKWSISNEELKTAFKSHKQVYIFIEKNVFSEFETYLYNKDTKNIRYRYVDNTKIFQFIDELKGLSSNNNIKAFETSTDIKDYLKDQLAGLFQSFLSDQSKSNEVDLAIRLEKTSETLEKLVDYLKESNKDKEEGITKLFKMNHPFVNHLEEILNIKFNFWIDNLEELKDLLSSIGWQYEENDDKDASVSYLWIDTMSTPFEDGKELRISKDLFDDKGNLKDIKASEWKVDFIKVNDINNGASSTVYDPNDLPF